MGRLHRPKDGPEERKGLGFGPRRAHSPWRHRKPVYARRRRATNFLRAVEIVRRKSHVPTFGQLQHRTAKEGAGEGEEKARQSGVRRSMGAMG